MRLRGKKILLGVTGSIAAYKSAVLLRSLIKEGADVQVLMSESGKQFITPVTLSALSGKPVQSDFFSNTDGTWHSHVEMGLWADLFIIAPASANTIAKMGNGICDNLLLTTWLSVKCPVFIAPAMDLDMFAHPITQQNLEKLKNLGVKVIEPTSGELASGLEGKGRMEEPENILDIILTHFNKDKILKNKNILINAGPTYEAIDPVRFIGNHSSGKMGYSLADAAANMGAKVTLVSGPVSLEAPKLNTSVYKVTTAKQMYDTTMKLVTGKDIIILCAAVADFTVKESSSQKIKRKEKNITLELVPTKDIAASIGASKIPGQTVVGFALESQDELENAQAKLEKKNLDFIVLNSINDEGAGFGTDTNKVTILSQNGHKKEFPIKSKKEVAEDILKYIFENL